MNVSVNGCVFLYVSQEMSSEGSSDRLPHPNAPTPTKPQEIMAERVKSSNEPFSVKPKVAAFYFSFKCNSACRNQPFKARILQLSQRFFSSSARSSPHSADCRRTKAGKWITNDLLPAPSGKVIMHFPSVPLTSELG